MIKGFCIAFCFLWNASAFAYGLKSDTLKIKENVSTSITQEEYALLKVGDLLPPHLYLYDTAGNKVFMDSLFEAGKPVMFITGSYSCPKFRKAISSINEYNRKMGSISTIVIVYVKEAHPVKNSPYGKKNNNLKENRKEGIKLKEHKYIEERIRLSKKVISDLKPNVEVLVDNENNDFFNSIFSGPNGQIIFSRAKRLESQKYWFKYVSSGTRKAKNQK